MKAMGHGRHELVTGDVTAGALYRFKLNGLEVPDPYARRLPQGVHGPAEVVRSQYEWTALDWRGLPPDNIIYELHVGTFTPEGTYTAVIDKLPELISLGITAIELMPVSSAAGQRGWGYDGVAQFAPFEPYGTPDELKHLVDSSHKLGLGIILDVVYNHFGPAGNYLVSYSPDYFTKELRNPWGDAPNYANPYMRQLVLDNALYWLEDFRMDGLRLDAVHEIPDRSDKHILSELADAVAELEGPRRYLFAEDDRNDPLAVAAHGLDALWADDFHHVTHVLLTGESDGYYQAYAPSVEDLAKTVRDGWYYQGQAWPLSGKSRGRPRGPLAYRQLLYCLQNHDQVGNRPLGERLNHVASVQQYCAASMLLLFLPMTPLLFMGQEWAATSPFLFFTDHDKELGQAITEGRRREFAHFSAFRDAPESEIPDPQALGTFLRSKLDWDERDRAPHSTVLRMYRSLLALRKSDPVLSAAPDTNLRVDAVGQLLIMGRWLGEHQRQLIVNFGDEEQQIPGHVVIENVLAESQERSLVERRLAPHSAVLLTVVGQLGQADRS